MIHSDYVSDVMHSYDKEGFDTREPTAKTIPRFPKHPIGIHERWSADGHDKCNKIGFPIYAIVDEATGKWIGAWVVPSNRVGEIVAYLVLCTVEKYGGKPIVFISITTLTNAHQASPYNSRLTVDLKRQRYSDI